MAQDLKWMRSGRVANASLWPFAPRKDANRRTINLFWTGFSGSFALARPSGPRAWNSGNRPASTDRSDAGRTVEADQGGLNETGLVPDTRQMADSVVVCADHPAADARGGCRARIAAIRAVASWPLSGSELDCHLPATCNGSSEGMASPAPSGIKRSAPGVLFDLTDEIGNLLALKVDMGLHLSMGALGLACFDRLANGAVFVDRPSDVAWKTRHEMPIG